ncbi:MULTISPECIES: hypothetical protein [Natrialbaceae]|uniref:hypothetical protein n=1 Tax=Natrialbaceae TaxID=1644061 RepID=UPI00207C43C3|nr:hypothetical protein [Natronococcus sp. CG52]
MTAAVVLLLVLIVGVMIALCDVDPFRLTFDDGLADGRPSRDEYPLWPWIATFVVVSIIVSRMFLGVHCRST